MPRARPPRDCPSPDGPKVNHLPPGLKFWRIHGLGRGPLEFRSTGAVDKRRDPLTFGNEGRFDCQTGEYEYLYLGETRLCTFAEAFLRDDVVRDPSARYIRRDNVTRAAISRIETTDSVALVDLRGAVALGRVGQDAWLTASEEVDYPLTQEWATAIRRWAPDADGFYWMAKRDDTHAAVVLFDDHAVSERLEGRVVYAFGDPSAYAYALAQLAKLNVAVR